MDLINRFQQYVIDNKLFSNSDKLLVAVSGGKDSMLLLWLMMKQGYQVVIAHCNFQLRGEESDADEKLVLDFAKKHQIPIHTISFDTVQYAERHKLSIQMAARELRYDWFSQLAQEIAADKIVIAQHKNDHVETVLLNLTRGTGLLGLQGILSQREENNIVRPMLCLDHNDIRQLVEQYQIPYRDDQSNFSNKYARNKIRLDIIPQFEQLNPDFIQIMDDNIQRFQEANQVLQELIEDLRKQIFAEHNGQWIIRKDELFQLSVAKIYYLFEPFGFSKSVLQDLLDSLQKESGRVFESDTHQILLNRDELILCAKQGNIQAVSFNMDDQEVQWDNYKIEIKILENVAIIGDPNVALLDAERLMLPLQIRSWEHGDVFQPLGMKGKKKISDFFIQRKINLFEKNRIPLLVNGNGDIMWVMGLQIDERYKITENTQKVLKLVISKS